MRTETKKNEKKKKRDGKGELWNYPATEKIITKYSLSRLVRLSWVLAGHVSRGAVC